MFSKIVAAFALLASLCVCALPVCAQNSNLGPPIGSGLPPVPSYYTGAIQFPGAPSGACAAPMLAENAATGHLFDCLNGSWNDIGSTGGGGNALTSNPLSQFAATTSAQLAGVLSDETGTGLAVFATNPVLTTPNLGTPSAINLTNATSPPTWNQNTSGTAANLSGTPAVPNGTTATTQSNGDATTKLATDAFVINQVSTGCLSSCSYNVGNGNDSPVPDGSTTSTMTSNNVPQLIKFWNNATRTLANATLRVTTIGAGGHFDAGVYSATGTLLWHAGSQSTASVANILVTPTPITLSANTAYYIAWCADNTSAILTGVTNGGAVGTIGASSVAHTYGIDSTDTCTAGVLPSSITISNIANNASATFVGIYATN